MSIASVQLPEEPVWTCATLAGPRLGPLLQPLRTAWPSDYPFSLRFKSFMRCGFAIRTAMGSILSCANKYFSTPILSELHGHSLNKWPKCRGSENRGNPPTALPTVSIFTNKSAFSVYQRDTSSCPKAMIPC